MGKFVGFIGSIRGKVGNVVFAKGADGVTYGRAYQPQVANPKTMAQTDQRAKMNLVGRMSQVTPKGLLVGLGFANNRQRRSWFCKNLLNVATVDRSAPDSVVAKIDPEDVVFSRGAEVISASMSDITVTDALVSFKLKLNDESLSGKYGERVAVAIIDPIEKGGYSQVRYIERVLEDTVISNLEIAFLEAIEANSLVCIYRMPFVLNEDGAAVYSSSLDNDGENITAALLSSGANYVRGWGNSVLEDARLFTQA